MDKKIVLSIIVGSTRPGRFSSHVSTWITDIVSKNTELEIKVLDLLNYDLPFFNDPVSPAYKTSPYANPVVEKWTSEIASSDAFIMITPEYNHGPSAVLKNSLDWVFKEWQHKPVGFVSYGSTGGSRAVEQLRLNAIELSMVPVRSAVHIRDPWLLTNSNGQLLSNALDNYTKSVENLVADLVWYCRLLASKN